LLAKAAADGNAAALDRGLEALVAFLAKAPGPLVESHVAPRACAALASKCLAARPATAAKAAEALLLFAEAGAGAAAVAALVEHGFAHKVPRASAAGLDAAAQLVRAFGPKHVPVKGMLGALAPALDARDAGVRAKAKALVAEIGRWTGADLVKAALFAGMRDASRDEVGRMLADAGAGEGRPAVERLTRAERRAREEREAAGGGGGGAGEGEGDGDGDGAAAPAAATPAAADDDGDDPLVDIYETAEPLDLTPDLRKDFWDGLASAKWSERRDAFSALRALAASRGPRLDPAGECLADLSRELRKAIGKDSNAAVVAEAARCCGALASGLRASYVGSARALCPLLLDKLKDKSAAVSGAAAEALLSFHARGCLALPDVGEEICAALGHANPKVREGALAWLSACVGAEAKGAVSKLGAAGVLAAAARCAEDGAPATREAALGFLAAAARRAGTLAALDKATAKMDEGKKRRLEEMVAALVAAGGDKAGSAGAAVPARAAAAAAPAAAAAAPSRRATAASVDGGGASASSSSFVRPGSRPAAVRAAMPSRAGGAGPPATAAKPPPRAAGGGAAASSSSAAADNADDGALLQGALSRDQALEALAEMLPGGEAAVAALTDPLWKARLPAMEQQVVPKAAAVAAWTGGGGGESGGESGALAADGARLVQALAHVPGWDAEKNFQVLQRAFEAARLVATSPLPGAFGRREAAAVAAAAADKLPDPKLRAGAADALFAAAEAVGPRFVAACLHRRGAAHKNPKAYAEALTWAAAAFEGFGAGAMDVPAAVGWAKGGLASAAPAVKGAAVALLGTLHAFLGPALADAVRPDVKPALMATLEGEFERRPKGDFAQPFKYVSRAAAGGGAGGGGGGARAEPAAASAAGAGRPPRAPAAAAARVAAPAARPPPAPRGGDDPRGDDEEDDSLLPRADASARIASPSLLQSLVSSDWKERKSAVEAIDAALSASGSRIGPAGLAELAPVLRQRFADTNRNLAAQALQTLGRLARASGRPGARELRPALAPALRCLGDAKPQVRAAVVEALEAWAQPEAAADELAEALAAPKVASEGMVAGLGWLAHKLAGGGGGAAAWLATSSGDGGGGGGGGRGGGNSGGSGGSGFGAAGSVAACIGLGAAYKTSQVREAAAVVAAAFVAAAGPRAAAEAAAKGPQDRAVRAAAQEAVSKAAAAAAPAGPLAAAATAAAPAPAPAAAPVHAAPPPPTARAPRPATAAAPAPMVNSPPATARAPAFGGGGAFGGAGAAAVAAPPAEPVFAAVDTRKGERARKARFRGARYDPRPDEAQSLEAELGPLLTPEMRALFFSKEFRKHCSAADAVRDLVGACSSAPASPGAAAAAAAGASAAAASAPNDDDDHGGGGAGGGPPTDPAVLGALDLLLRWAVLRLAEGNTSTLLSVTAMLRALLSALARSPGSGGAGGGGGGRLSDHEARCLLPGLVEKCGQPQERLRHELRDLLRRSALLHPPARVLAFAREGLDSKNNRTRVACAEEIGLLIAREGPRLYSAGGAGGASGGGAGGGGANVSGGGVMPTTPGGTLAQQQQQASASGVGVVAVLARLTSERDKDARQAALGALEQVHRIEGAQGVWRQLAAARLTDQQRSLVEERLRSSERELAKKGLVPGYRAAEFGLPAPAEVVQRQQQLQQQPGGRGGAAPAPALAGGSGGFSSARPVTPPPAGMSGAAMATYLPASRPMTAAAGAGADGHHHHQAPAATAATAAAAAALPAAAASASSGPPLQPLARLGGDPALLRAEWRRLLALLTDAPVEDAVDAMKLLCYEMMDAQRVAAGGAACAAMPPEQRAAVAAVGALLDGEGDALAAAVAARTDAIFAAASAAIRAGALPNARACKYCLNALMNQFGHPSGAAAVTPATLRCVVRALLLRLVDDALGRLPEGEALLRALNVLMLKVLDHCDRTACFEVLLRLLREPPAEVVAAAPWPSSSSSAEAAGGGGPASTNDARAAPGSNGGAAAAASGPSAGEARWSDLVVKCLIKLTKGLPLAVERGQADPPRLLLAVHEFFEALGVDEIRRRGAREDKPLRMAKTVLHELCKLEGGAIYRHTAGIPAVSASTGGRPVIFPYIDLNLQTLQQQQQMQQEMQQQHARPATFGAGGVGAGAPSSSLPAAASSAAPSYGIQQQHHQHQNEQAGADTGAHGGPSASAPAPAASAAAAPAAAAAPSSSAAGDFQGALAQIFRRIAAKEDVAGALRALDALLAAHGQGAEDVEALLGGTSAAFRSFITRGLAKVRAQQQQQQEQQEQGSAGAGVSGGGGGGPTATSAAAFDAAGPAPSLRHARSSLDVAPTPSAAAPAADQATQAASPAMAAAPSVAPSAAGSLGGGGAGYGARGGGGGGSAMTPGSLQLKAAAAAAAAGPPPGGAGNMDQLRDRLRQIQAGGGGGVGGGGGGAAAAVPLAPAPAPAAAAAAGAAPEAVNALQERLQRLL